ncbi:MAG TPA: histidinol dehydrogenase, partial [Nitrospirae bacterium]|nr:histidinol dehydrogenase [Nitrospirota bacterium]
MRILNEKQVNPFLTSLEKRASGSIREDDVQKLVKKIIIDVQKNGDKAVIKYTKKFDSVELKKICATKKEIESAAKKVDLDFMKVLKTSTKRIRKFHEKQKESSWQFTEDGITLGQIIRPLERVGVYIPGGKAAYPSTVLMNVIPAQVAGVTEIALCVPNLKGRIDPYVAAAIKLLGVTEVYKIGGAQAVAAMAYGTKTIKKVDKIVGPGNIYVAIAKRMVFGQVGIDMIAGPSEILIIADKTA